MKNIKKENIMYFYIVIDSIYIINNFNIYKIIINFKYNIQYYYNIFYKFF